MKNLLSIGIDIGTSTTQMILSELRIENTSSAYSIPRISITDKEVIFKSEIMFTPIDKDNLIDAQQIQTFVTEQYQKAGIAPKDIQTGAIIITGETVRKENSRAVADALSGYAGDFVVATAGPDLESIIAGKGAGAHSYSEKNHCSTLNLDIGGGTTNVVIFEDGVTVDTACFDIGGRLIKVDENQIIQYISPKFLEIISNEKINLKIGKRIDLIELDKLLDIIIDVLQNIVGIGSKNIYYDLLITNKSLNTTLKADFISFSGGVADYINRETNQSELFRYGDIGIILGRRIYQSEIYKHYKVLESIETIRATVVGAGSHTTSVSGSTIHFRGDILPLKNIPVVKMTPEEEQSEDLANIIEKKIQWFDFKAEEQTVAISFKGLHNPTFSYIQSLANRIWKGVNKLIEIGYPIVIIIEEDMAKALGQTLFSLLSDNDDFIVLDNIYVNDGDYIDIGNPISEGQVLPVVIKTLVFN
ncbi:ethanolamine ammonia-lyase reactivating factor EutA [Fundicoccus culcitae]|uniref:Ethanolamine ammonia-lyase reactivating factor EutA n=1 Tax=Fundicoccus culcitae TaxID=2969821 RepID=A0ABY5P3Z8_9LACT|nr:ethanolamine ammonia-lyase reactivating factor EutA [Fundicoccus culcitae]UUX33325.1 ethanolamine ammonia-lyase reactivating factor EutA [Fundicoccus culcitae]